MDGRGCHIMVVRMQLSIIRVSVQRKTSSHSLLELGRGILFHDCVNVFDDYRFFISLQYLHRLALNSWVRVSQEPSG